MTSIFVFHLWLIAAIALSFLLLSADVRKLCVSEGRARSPHQIVEVAAAAVSEFQVDVMTLEASIHVLLFRRSEWESVVSLQFRFLALRGGKNESKLCLWHIL